MTYAVVLEKGSYLYNEVIWMVYNQNPFFKKKKELYKKRKNNFWDAFWKEYPHLDRCHFGLYGGNGRNLSNAICVVYYEIDMRLTNK